MLGIIAVVHTNTLWAPQLIETQKCSDPEFGLKEFCEFVYA